MTTNDVNLVPALFNSWRLIIKIFFVILSEINLSYDTNYFFLVRDINLIFDLGQTHRNSSLRYTLGRSKGMFAYTANGYMPIYFRRGAISWLSTAPINSSSVYRTRSIVSHQPVGRLVRFGSRISHIVTSHLTFIPIRTFVLANKREIYYFFPTHLKFLNRQNVVCLQSWFLKPLKVETDINDCSNNKRNWRSCVLSEAIQKRIVSSLPFNNKHIYVWMCTLATIKE